MEAPVTPISSLPRVEEPLSCGFEFTLDELFRNPRLLDDEGASCSSSNAIKSIVFGRCPICLDDMGEIDSFVPEHLEDPLEVREEVVDLCGDSDDGEDGHEMSVVEDKHASRDDPGVALIDGCMHAFCFLCILQWSLVNKHCPLCKAPFENLFFRLQLRGERVEYDTFALEDECAMSDLRVPHDADALRVNPSSRLDQDTRLRRLVYLHHLKAAPFAGLVGKESSLGRPLALSKATPYQWEEGGLELFVTRELRAIMYDVDVMYLAILAQRAVVAGNPSSDFPRQAVERALGSVLMDDTHRFIHEIACFQVFASNCPKRLSGAAIVRWYDCSVKYHRDDVPPRHNISKRKVEIVVE